MGYSALSIQQIEKGVRILLEAVEQLKGEFSETDGRDSGFGARR